MSFHHRVQDVTLYVLLLVTLTIPMDVPLISPVIPEMRNVFGVSNIQSTLIISLFTLPGIICAPLIGILGDRFGRIRILVPCLLIYGTAGTIIPLAPNFETVLMLRFLQGCFSVGPVILVITLFGDYYLESERNRVLGFNSAMLSFGDTVYPLIGGVLGVIIWFAPFLLYSLSMIMAVVVAVTLVEPEINSNGLQVLYFKELVHYAFEVRSMLVLVGILANFMLLFGVIYTLVPLMLNDLFKLDSSVIGLLLTLPLSVAILVALANGMLSRYLSNQRLILIGFLLYGVSFVLLSFATTPSTISFVLVFSGIAYGLILPSIDSTLTSLVGQNLRAGMVSFRAVLVRIGQTLGPFVVMISPSWLSFGDFVFIAGVATALGTVIAVFLVKKL